MQVLESLKKVQGAQHSSTLTSMENLAHNLRAQGRNQTTCTLIIKDCVSISYRILRPDRPYTVDRDNTIRDGKRT